MVGIKTKVKVRNSISGMAHQIKFKKEYHFEYDDSKDLRIASKYSIVLRLKLGNNNNEIV